MTTRRITNEQIDRLLRPKSVAVVGASDRTGALGATLLNNLVQYEFAGDIYPVNPKRDELLGLKVYHSVEELPEGIDCAVLDLVPNGLRFWARIGLRRHGHAEFLSQVDQTHPDGGFISSGIAISYSNRGCYEQQQSLRIRSCATRFQHSPATRCAARQMRPRPSWHPG